MSWAGKYIGTPYVERGRALGGADCWGLCRLVWEIECGIIVPSYLKNSYQDTGDRDADAKLVQQAVLAERTKWHEVEVGEEQEFDAVIMRLLGRPIHIGVVVNPGLMLHCEVGHNAVAERYDSLKWEKRIIGFYRHPNRT